MALNAVFSLFTCGFVHVVEVECLLFSLLISERKGFKKIAVNACGFCK